MRHHNIRRHLRDQNLSENTIASYLWTVNLRIQAINKYLVLIGKEKMQLEQVKVQQKNFLENVISNADYQYLKSRLKADGNLEWYFVVRFFGVTGGTGKRSYADKGRAYKIRLV